MLIQCQCIVQLIHLFPRQKSDLSCCPSSLHSILSFFSLILLLLRALLKIQALDQCYQLSRSFLSILHISLKKSSQITPFLSFLLKIVTNSNFPEISFLLSQINQALCRHITFNMKRVDQETGNPARTVDIKMLLNLSQVSSFNKAQGPDILGRLGNFQNYIGTGIKNHLLLYNRVMLTGPDTDVLAQDDNKILHYGVNYASADYLGLAQHPEAKKAAVAAIKKYGLSSTSPLNIGYHELYVQLKRELEEYWGLHMLIFSTGWMGGFGVINALVRPHDHVIMDHISHNCLQEGAISATKNVKKFEHLNQDQMVRKLRQTREQDPDNAILVVTEGLFSMDADSPDLIAYQKAAKQYGAYLLIDCAHDFGHIGPNGKGAWQMQGLTDFSNVIMCGTGSKCLSTNIGFIGAKDKRLIELIKRMTDSFENATVINPVQAATSLAQLNILRNQEGKDRRKKVTENYHYLRSSLEAKGHKIIGNPCAIMPVFIGNEVISRVVSRLMTDKGVHVNGIEYPVVKIGQARLRVCLLPQHTKAHLDKFVKVFEESMVQAQQILDEAMAKYSEESTQKQTAKL